MEIVRIVATVASPPQQNQYSPSIPSGNQSSECGSASCRISPHAAIRRHCPPILAFSSCTLVTHHRAVPAATASSAHVILSRRANHGPQTLSHATMYPSMVGKSPNGKKKFLQDLGTARLPAVGCCYFRSLICSLATFSFLFTVCTASWASHVATPRKCAGEVAESGASKEKKN